MLVLGSQFTKCFMSESPFLLSHPVITPMLYVTEEGCKQLLEMVLMGDSITWDIFHKSCISGGMNFAVDNHHHCVVPISLDNCRIPSICKRDSQAVSHCCSVACPNTTPKKKDSASVLHSTVSILAENSLKIADNFPFVTIPTNKRGITDMTR